MRQPNSIRAITLSTIQKHPEDTFKINDIVDAIRSDCTALPDTVRNIISTDFSRLLFVKRLTPYGTSIKGGVIYKITTLGRTYDVTKIPTGTQVRAKIPPLLREVDDSDVTELPPEIRGTVKVSKPTISASSDEVSPEKVDFEKKELKQKVEENTVQKDKLTKAEDFHERLVAEGFDSTSTPESTNESYSTRDDTESDSKMPSGVTSTDQVIKREDGAYLKLEGKLDQIAVGEAMFEYISSLKVKVLTLIVKNESLTDKLNQNRRAYREEITKKDERLQELELVVKKLRDCSIDTRKTFDLSEIVSMREERNKSS